MLHLLVFYKENNTFVFWFFWELYPNLAIATISTINHIVVAFSREETALEGLTLNLSKFQISIATRAFKSVEVVLEVMWSSLRSYAKDIFLYLCKSIMFSVFHESGFLKHPLPFTSSQPITSQVSLYHLTHTSIITHFFKTWT